ncbi:unnamed protein product [Paramecium primaurelia]|uniref:WD40-repeat-containing domain n=1 Tax=Paramecium primaurelia TaxID=5886 RepID=A0A8S1N985_PARPR|nr:unnamed protein product [Paramecium primaurelia]
MSKSKMIETEENFLCLSHQNEKICMIVLDPKLDKNKKFFCKSCLNNFESDAKTIGLQRILEIIEQIIDTNNNECEKIINETIQQLIKINKITEELKTSFLNLFDSIIGITSQWINNLQDQKEQQNQYSFYEELDNYIKNKNTNFIQRKKLINKINNSSMLKLHKTLSDYHLNKDKFNLGELKKQFFKIIQSNQFDQGDINLQQIDQSVKQTDSCKAIVFDFSGSIMLSTKDNDIQVWKFEDGTIQLINTLVCHTNLVSCLVYSKKQNSFISGSVDNAIICWQRINQIDWNYSQAYKQHTKSVKCILLNSKEDILFSGSDDTSINVWKVEFNKNQLTYLYSLNKHKNSINSLSLNKSENYLVSCAQDQNGIIIWEYQSQNKFVYKYLVKQSIQDYGLKVQFIKDNQFIWITGDKDFDQMYVFELKERVFQENLEKTIQLDKNNQPLDEFRFPIVYNEEKNLIVVRHKTHIYIIRLMNDGKFKIVNKLNFNTNKIFGTISNNGDYLVFWDDYIKQYSIYELYEK